MAATEEEAECNPPSVKKAKREKIDSVNGTAQNSPDVNGNINKPLKVNSDEDVNGEGEPVIVFWFAHNNFVCYTQR